MPTPTKGPRPGDAAPMVLIELVEQGEVVQRGDGDEGDGGTRRRRFGRGRSAADGEEAAPEGSNRAARRAAARRRGGAAAAAPEAAEAEAGGREDEDLAPNVPTDAEIEAGAAPLETDEDEDVAEEDSEDELQLEPEEAPAAEGDVDADLPDRLDPGRVRRILNAVAGPAIVVRQAAWAPEGFDARFSARRRTYVYRIDDSGGPDPLTRGYVLAWPRPLDLERMRSAAAPLVGEHDFAAFCRQRPGSSTRRRLRSIGVRRVRGLVEVRLVADAFCWQMARSIVGYLLGVGDGRRDPDGTAGVLAGRDRSKVGDVAPPHGLVLESVGYPSVERAVRGMLPHNRLGRQMIRKLKVYDGPTHPHAAQRPKTLDVGPDSGAKQQ